MWVSAVSASPFRSITTSLVTGAGGAVGAVVGAVVGGSKVEQHRRIGHRRDVLQESVAEHVVAALVLREVDKEVSDAETVD